MRETAFEERLVAIAGEMRYPTTPSLRGRVLTAIAAGEREGRLRRAVPYAAFLRPALTALVLALLAAGAIALILPATRSAVADFFGVAGSKIERLPTPAPGVTPTPLPAPADVEAYATPAALVPAEQAAGFSPALPAGFGEPLGVYLVDYGSETAIVLQYEGFDLWEKQGAGFFAKGVPPEKVIQDLVVAGRPAVWLAGGTHLVRFVDAQGREVAGSVRAVQRNTLVWSTAHASYRLETDLTLDDAIAIAEALP